ncbi:hypothetical protein ACIG87_08805 [Micromonospora sp. NPDC051925]|uniref:hypothetical protein n=1 Tax=Micromonospora sp. NPDC051925 TaxID=3364288 RepID=UPI0037CA0E69
MINVRRAVVADAGEIVRLRGVMLADIDQMAPAPAPGSRPPGRCCTGGWPSRRT